MVRRRQRRGGQERGTQGTVWLYHVPCTMYPWQQCWDGTGRTDQGAGCGSFRKRGVELYCFRKWLEGDKERMLKWAVSCVH